MKRLLLIAAVGAAVIGAAALVYRHDSPGGGSVAGNSTGWTEPADYTYTVAYSIFGPARGTYEITVRHHDVVGVRDIDPPDGMTEYRITVDNAWTLADLLAKYDQAKAGSESDATIAVDSAGVPRSISLDWIVDAVDDEEYFEIVAYHPGS